MVYQKISQKKLELYSISGKKNHGKDTFAQLINSANIKQIQSGTYNGPSFKIVHFADAVKQMIIRIFGLNEIQLYDSSLKDKLFSSPINMDMYLGAMKQETGLNINGLGLSANSPRQLMQFFGTNYVRSVQSDYWIQKLISEISGGRRVLVPDTRFRDEAQALRLIGGIIIKIVRLDFIDSDYHQSELDIDLIEPDLLIAIKTDDLSLPKRIANLIAAGKFSNAVKYDYRKIQNAIAAYTAGKSLEESSLFLGTHRYPEVLKNVLDYYHIHQRRDY